jgi:hypothetical protein
MAQLPSITFADLVLLVSKSIEKRSPGLEGSTIPGVANVQAATPHASNICSNERFPESHPDWFGATCWLRTANSYRSGTL